MTSISQTTTKSAAGVACPVCGCGSHNPVESFGQFTVVRCSGCTLEFSNPLDYDYKNYDLAYVEPGSHFVVPSLQWLEEAGVGLSEARWMLFSAQIEALEWLKSNIPTASVVDVGCGSGWFLGRARQLGFRAAGVEIGSAPAILLQEKGFDVVCGTVLSIPEDWRPDAVTLFEVLEHLPNPAIFLSGIRRRFPESILILSVPSPKRWTKGGSHRDLADYPPNHLTRWNDQCLYRALIDAGYARAQVNYSRPRALETASVSIKMIVRGWRSQLPDTLPEAIVATRLRALQKEVLIRKFKCVPGAIAAKAFEAIGWSGISMWAIAWP